MAAEKLGKRIRKFREERELSLEDLSRACNLSVPFLKELEESSVYPSIGPLQKIARAMNIRLGTFMDDVAVADPIICREQAKNADLVTHKAAGQAAANEFFSLGKGKNDRNMEPFFVTLNPEQEEDRKLSSHEGEEFILVSSGSMLLVYGDETYTLETGDTVYYNSIVPHYAGAAGGKPATIHAVIYYPR